MFASSKVHQRLLSDLYDMAVYYDDQLKALAFNSYNGLSNEHKRIHKIALQELSVLRRLLHLYTLKPEHVYHKIATVPDSDRKIIHLALHRPESIHDEYGEISRMYVVSLILEHDNDHNPSIRLKISDAFEDEEGEKEEKNALEIIYKVNDYSAQVSAFGLIYQDDIRKELELITPRISNKQYAPLQRKILYVPDLHIRILDLSVTLNAIS